MPTKSKIGELASKKTKVTFAEELAKHTTLTTEQIVDLFPLKADRDELIELLKVVNSASDDNTKKAKIIANAAGFGGALLKVAKGFAPGFVP